MQSVAAVKAGDRSVAEPRVKQRSGDQDPADFRQILTALSQNQGANPSQAPAGEKIDEAASPEETEARAESGEPSAGTTVPVTVGSAVAGQAVASSLPQISPAVGLAVTEVPAVAALPGEAEGGALPAGGGSSAGLALPGHEAQFSATLKAGRGETPLAVEAGASRETPLVGQEAPAAVATGTGDGRPVVAPADLPSPEKRDGPEPAPRLLSAGSAAQPQVKEVTAAAAKTGQQPGTLPEGEEHPKIVQVSTFATTGPDGQAFAVAPGADEQGFTGEARELSGAVLAREIVSQGLAVWQRGYGYVRLKLEPEFLGHVEVKVSSHLGRLAAYLVVENELVRGLVQACLPHLQQNLAQHGLALERFSVEIGGWGGGGATGGHSRAAYGGGSSGHPSFGGSQWWGRDGGSESHWSFSLVNYLA